MLTEIPLPEAPAGITSERAVVGVDPGARETGIVLRLRDWPLWAAVVVREDPGPLPGHDYVREVVDTVTEAWVKGLEYAAHDVLGPLVAVEGLVEPNPRLGMTALLGVMGTAVVLGAVILVPEPLVVVPPGGHGSAPLATYPDGLVSAAEKRGAGIRRHVRSAWDVALAGRRLARLEAAAAAAPAPAPAP